MIVWHVETSDGPRFDWAKDEEHLRQQLIEYNNDVLNEDDPDEQLPEDATLNEAIEKIEESESLSQEDMYGAYMIDPPERDTILAALRVYQDWRAGRKSDVDMVDEIAMNGRDKLLDAEEIDDLCERLNS